MSGGTAIKRWMPNPEAGAILRRDSCASVSNTLVMDAVMDAAWFWSGETIAYPMGLSHLVTTDKPTFVRDGIHSEVASWHRASPPFAFALALATRTATDTTNRSRVRAGPKV